jgi:hypothetical protein
VKPIQFECRGRNGHLELLTIGKIPGKAEYFVRVTSENGLPRIYTLNAIATQRSDTKFLPVSRVPDYVLTDLSLYWDVGGFTLTRKK